MFHANQLAWRLRFLIHKLIVLVLTANSAANERQLSLLSSLYWISSNYSSDSDRGLPPTLPS